jgi:hypothetical protein
MTFEDIASTTGTGEGAVPRLHARSAKELERLAKEQ